MRLLDFDLNLLIYLDALLGDKSVSKAALRIGISQPAMSDALARLRYYFKDDLLVQVGGRGMVLTPMACSLSERVREILLGAQSLVASKANFDPFDSDQKFTIMASDYVFDVLIRHVLMRLSRVAPRIRIEMRRLPLNVPEHAERPDLDLLFSPKTIISGLLPSELVFEDSITCVVWSQSALVGNEISFDQYMQMGHVCSSWEGENSEFENWFLKRFGAKRRVEVLAPDFGTVLRAVEGTNRIATVHTRHARMYATDFSLRIIKPPVDFPALGMYMQWHKHQDADTSLKWLRGLIKSTADGYTSPSAARG